MFEKTKALVARFKKNVDVYRRVLKDPRTPWPAKAMLGLAIGYLVFPIDLIPDCIPVIGYLDDILLIIVAVYLAKKLVPPEVFMEHRKAVLSKAKNAVRELETPETHSLPESSKDALVESDAPERL